MHEPLTLIMCWIAGVLLGAMFFGGLWWTVLKAVSSKRPALWFFVSLWLRTGIALAGFYMISGGHWERLLGCLLGFFIARVVVTRMMRSSGQPRTRAAQEVSHASEPG